ncbi:MAG: alpha/beta hydrolase [Candidatus Zixiibacteriota bacterium]|nr:MAG: alpha/beta hydrolase [candidate division Zixibacteria bacterium]
MPRFDSKGVNIYYEIGGTGTPVVFLHGFTLDTRMWQDQFDFFSRNRTAIVFDARGHGKSDSPQTGYAREDRTADLLNLADHLRLLRFHLVGFSMGGGDALAFAIDHQERLLSLTLIGSVAAGWQGSRRYHDFAPLAKEQGVEEAKQQYMSSILSYYDKHRKDLRDKLGFMISEFRGGPWLDPMKGKYVKRDDLKLAGNLEIPTLVAVGQRDIFLRPLAGQLHEVIPGSRLEVFSDTGHVVNMEVPDRLNNCLDSFFGEVEKGTAV